MVLNFLKSFSLKRWRWQTFLVFSYIVRASSKFFITGCWTHIMIIDYDDYFVKLRCQTGNLSFRKVSRSIFIYAVYANPASWGFLDTLKIKMHFTYCVCACLIVSYSCSTTKTGTSSATMKCALSVHMPFLCPAHCEWCKGLKRDTAIQ